MIYALIWRDTSFLQRFASSARSNIVTRDTMLPRSVFPYTFTDSLPTCVLKQMESQDRALPGDAKLLIQIAWTKPSTDKAKQARSLTENGMWLEGYIWSNFQSVQQVTKSCSQIPKRGKRTHLWFLSNMVSKSMPNKITLRKLSSPHFFPATRSIWTPNQA